MLPTKGVESDVHTACTLAPRLLVRWFLVLAVLAFLMPSTRSRAQDSPWPAPPDRIDTYGPIDVLTDTNGFNLKPYVGDIVGRVKATWLTLIPKSARWPIREPGHVSVDFRITKDGSVDDVKYHETSGNEGFDRAAYGAVTSSGPMPPLPAEFQCQFIKMRFHFYYNENPARNKERGVDGYRAPCVTSAAPSKATRVEKLPLAVSPGTIQIAPGAQAKFVAKIYGLVNSAVTWSVQGSGCERSACGVISSDGHYTAPDKIPDPPEITVIATSTVTPSQSASGTVKITAESGAH